MSDNGTSSSRKRRRCNQDDGEDGGLITEVKRLTMSLKSVKLCVQCLPNRLCCDGCIQFINSVLPLGKFSEENLVIKTQERLNKGTYTTPKFRCKQPWKQEWTEADGKWINEVSAFLEATYPQGHGRDNTIEEATEDDDGPAPVSPSTSVDETEDNVTEDNMQTPVKQTKKALNFYTKTISSNKHKVDVQLPTTHSVVYNPDLKRMENAERILKGLQASFDRERFSSKASHHTKSLMATALAAAPSIAVTTLAGVIPLIVGSFLCDHGVLDHRKFSLEKFCKSFPKETWLRDIMAKQAAECTITLGRQLTGKRVYIQSDKGHKGNIEHMVKIESHFDMESRKVVKKLIDVDASGNTNEDAAKAIAHSLKKINCGDNWKVGGQTTDWGGGGTGVGLGRELQTKYGHLCHDFYLVLACAIHNLQCQLSNGVNETMGQGQLDKRNMFQLLHSAHAIQNTLSAVEFQEVFDQALDVIKSMKDGTYTNTVPQNANEKKIYRRLKTVMSFRDFGDVNTLWPLNVNEDTGEEKTSRRKIPQPVLTRWHFVGECASVVWRSYLLLYQISQCVVNTHGTSAVGTMASNLQSLMLQPELFSDLALLKCFHDAYFTKEMCWLMKSKDLTNVPGFQAHQMVPRFYIMMSKLECMRDTMIEEAADPLEYRYHPAFKDFRDTLHIPGVDRAMQVKKAINFVNHAIKSCKKHFPRWCFPRHLPAALCAEERLAKAVARAILQVQPTTDEDLLRSRKMYFKSTIHGEFLSEFDFESFVREQLQAHLDNEDTPFTTEAISSATRLLKGEVSFRDINIDVVEPEQEYIWTVYLPIASQSQHVEGGVKDCRFVATTGRHEESRSQWAICRSHLITKDAYSDEANLNDMTPAERALRFFKAAEQHAVDQDALEEEESDWYKNQMTMVLDSIRGTGGKTSKRRREEELSSVVKDRAKTNRKLNKRQQLSGVDRPLALTGLIGYSLLRKSVHKQAVRMELTFRGCGAVEIDTFLLNKWKEMKLWLKNHELRRVQQQDSSTGDIEMAKEGFMPLSEATFEEQD